MNTDVIDKAFAELIYKRAIHKKLRITSGRVRTIRYNLAHGNAVSTDLKLKLLQQSGWTQSNKVYSRKDLISLLKFYRSTSESARSVGDEYVIEKWLRTKIIK